MGGNRPDIGNRPQIGGGLAGGNRLGLASANRPSTLPSLPGGNRPGGPGGGLAGGGNRPGGGGAGERFPGRDRPGGGAGDRFPGGGDGRPNRPVIGGGGNRPNIGGDNINIGNRVNIGSGNIGGGNFVGNRPGWDHGGWNNPGWGLGGGGWAGNWHNNCINPSHGWYNGCWNGNWGSNWYAPLAWGAVGWGLGSLTSGWGYGSEYSNPYYSEPVVADSVPYDYSQPVVVNNYASQDADPSAPNVQAAPAPIVSDSDQATALFDEGLALFKSGDYRSALGKFDTALKKLPGDPVVHEVRAQTLFALGEYQQSAVALNSLLSSAPGMDWTTMSSLYGNADDYQAQLRKLEQFCASNRNDASAYFVLAYEYLVMDSKDTAVKALKVVVKNQPKDYTAKRMLDALAPADQVAAAPVAAAPAGTGAPSTDLVGDWRAKAGNTTIDLTISDDSQFTWKAMQGGKSAAELKGQVESTSDELALESADQGSIAGSVKSLGPDKWQFALSGAPPSEPGLSFQRVRR